MFVIRNTNYVGDGDNHTSEIEDTDNQITMK